MNEQEELLIEAIQDENLEEVRKLLQAVVNPIANTRRLGVGSNK